MSLTDSMARGFAWYTAQTVIFKVSSVAGQILLTYLLLPEAFGLILMAGVVSMLAGMIQSAGIREVLVRRQARLHRWVNPAFWMSLSLGCGAMLFMVAAAPVASRIFSEPALLGLLLALAPYPLIVSFGTVPMATLQAQLRFRRLAALLGMLNLSQLSIYILFAALGFGAYSFVISRLLGAALYVGVMWRCAHPVIRARPEVRRWRFLVCDSALLFATATAYALMGQADAIVSGIFFSTEAAGLYFVALTLSLQTLQLVTYNLEALMYPVLSKLQGDVIRQAQAFIRANRALSVVAVPLCLLQAAAAEPVIRLLLPARLHDIVAPVQALSLGMAFMAIAMPSGSLVMAQGRFAARLKLAVVSVLIQFTCVILGTWLIGTILGVATGVAISVFLISVLSVAAALHPARLGLAGVARALLLPILMGAIAVAPAWLVAEALPLSPPFHWVRVVVLGIIAPVIYLPLIRTFMPDAWEELAALADRMLLSRLRGRSSPDTAHLTAPTTSTP